MHQEPAFHSGATEFCEGTPPKHYACRSVGDWTELGRLRDGNRDCTATKAARAALCLPQLLQDAGLSPILRRIGSRKQVSAVERGEAKLATTTNGQNQGDIGKNLAEILEALTR
jgi:hypothetical protein